MQVGKVDAGDNTGNGFGHFEHIRQRAQHGGFAADLRAQGDRVAGCAQFIHTALQARDGDLQHLIGRAAEVGAGMEDDVGGAGQVAKMGGVHQVLAQARPFFVSRRSG